MVANEISNTETVRNVFIIDDKGIIRVILVYPLNVGRCIPEILRIIEALQTADCSKASTPANWIPGDPVIVPAPVTCNDLVLRNREISQKQNGMSWYLSFKNPVDCKTQINSTSETKKLNCKNS